MKVEEITRSVSWNVTIDGVDYVRNGPEAWYRWYGESLEAEYYCEELEEAFQKELNRRIRRNNV